MGSIIHGAPPPAVSVKCTLRGTGGALCWYRRRPAREKAWLPVKEVLLGSNELFGLRCH
jgi:hypothetical protein